MSLGGSVPPATTPEAVPAAPTPSPGAGGTAGRSWQAVDAQQRGVRAGLLTIAIVMLGVASIVAFYCAMRIASIWFEHQYEPIAQLVVAGVVVAVCVRVIRGLGRPPHPR